MRLRFNSATRSAQPKPEASQSSIQEWTDETGRIIAQGYSDKGYHWLHWPDYATFRFNDSNDVDVINVANTSQEIISDLFYRSVYPLILQSRGIEVLHASAISTSNGVVAFCADSGSGKSTLAYGLSRRGYQLWADDAVAIEINGNHLSAVQLPFSIRLLPDAAAHFQQVNPLSSALRNISYSGPENYPASPVLAICLLNRHETTKVDAHPVNPADAFPRLLSQAYYYQIPDPTHKQTMMKHYLDIVDRIPIHQLDFPVGFEYFDTVLDQTEKIINQSVEEM